MVRTGQWSPKHTTLAISNRVYEIWPELSTSSNMVPRIIESLNIVQFNPNDHGLRIKILDKIMAKIIYHHQYATKHGAGYISSITCDKTIKFTAVTGPIKPPLKNEAIIKSVSSTDPINSKPSSIEIIKSELAAESIKPPIGDTYDLIIDGWDINDDTIALSVLPINCSIKDGVSIKSVSSIDSINIGASSTGIIKSVLSTDSTNIDVSSAGIIKSALSTDSINIGVLSTAVDQIKPPLTADPIKYRIKDGVLTKPTSLSITNYDINSNYIKLTSEEIKNIWCYNNYLKTKNLNYMVTYNYIGSALTTDVAMIKRYKFAEGFNEWNYTKFNFKPIYEPRKFQRCFIIAASERKPIIEMLSILEDPTKFAPSTDTINIGASSTGIIKSVLSTDSTNIGVSSTDADLIKHPLTADWN